MPYTTYYILYAIYCILYTITYIPYTVYCMLYIVYVCCKQYTIYCIIYIMCIIHNIYIHTIYHVIHTA